MVYYSRAHAHSRKRAHVLLQFNSIQFDSFVSHADVCVCYFVLFFPLLSLLASTNRLIKLITDWTIRRKMMEWIEHKLSNGWKAIDWINTNETTWTSALASALTHTHMHNRRGRAKGKLKACSPIAIISWQMKRCIHDYCVCCVCACASFDIEHSAIVIVCVCALYAIYIYNISIVCGPFTKQLFECMLALRHNFHSIRAIVAFSADVCRIKLKLINFLLTEDGIRFFSRLPNVWWPIEWEMDCMLFSVCLFVC